MAFQASFALPGIVTATPDILPTMSTLLSAPWKALRHPRTSIEPEQVKNNSRDRQAQRLVASFSDVARKVDLPECLESTPPSALRAGSDIGIKPMRPSHLSLLRAHDCLQSRQSQNRPSVLSTSNNLFSAFRSTRPPPPTISPSRGFSSPPPFHSSHPRPQIPSKPTETIFRRSFMDGGSGLSQSLLAHTEKTANNNPTSATAQSAFYNALLRANLPALIVERYSSGRYATNASCDEAFQKAMQMLGGGSAVVGSGSNFQPRSHNGQISQEQLQAIGQAVAAQSRGGKIGMASGKVNSGTGAKDAPLHVVVEETVASTVLRWVKFLFWAGFIGYLFFFTLQVAVDMAGVMKPGRAIQNNEAQPQHQNVRFSDVHGCDEAKDELQELVEFLINPDRFSSLGGKLPKGVLLVGPPGTGKTLLARAVAGEAGCPFFYMSGSEFDEMYVGVGAKRVRELFNQARAKAPSIIFIDELDAVGAKRNERDPAYAKQTLNQLLTELDGFSPSTGVILIAATNYPQMLDKALTRPGRFDRRVVVPLPDVRGRIEILKHHMKNVQVSTEVDATLIARGTSGFSGADLENLVNQAAIRASRNKAKKVGPLDFEWAKDKIMMGAEQRSRVIREQDKLMTAYHEAGHALVALFTDGAQPLHKMTIIQRGMALGVTHFLPEMDQASKAYKEYLADIDVALGGRQAEELIYGPNQVSSGITNDLQNATAVAHALVTRMGYSEKLGNVDLASDYNTLSSETKQLIENEVRRIVEEGRHRAMTILTSKRKELEMLCKALMEFETLTREEMEKVIRGEKLEKLESERVGKATPIKLPDVLMPPGMGGVPGDNSGSTNARLAADGAEPSQLDREQEADRGR